MRRVVHIPVHTPRRLLTLWSRGQRRTDPWDRVYFAGAAGIVLLSLVLKLWAGRQWSWFQDDWSYLERTTDMPVWNYLVQDYNGHFMPLQFLVVWGITALAPLEYGLAILVLMALIAGGTLTWWALLHNVFGARPQVLLGLAIIAFCPLLIQGTLWWAAGLQVYSLSWSMAATLLFAHRYLDTGARRYAAFFLVAFVVGLLAWQKALLIALPVGFTLFLLPGVPRTGAVRRHRLTMLCLAIIISASAYAVAFLWFTWEPVPGDASLGLPAAEPSIGFALTAGLGIVLPSIVGGTWTPIDSLQGAFPLAPAWFQWILGTAALMLLVASFALRRKSLAIATMPIAYALAAWALVVGSSRFESLGQFVSLDARYSSDLVPVVALALVYLTTSTQLERRSPGLGAWRSHLPGAWLVGLKTACAVMALSVIVSSLITWSAQMEGLQISSPRPWVDTVLASSKSVGQAVVFDSTAPSNVIFPAFFPEDAKLSRMLAPLHLPLTFDAPTESLLTADLYGRIVPAEIGDGAASLPGNAEGCGYIVKSDQWTFIPLNPHLPAWNWGLEFDYLTEGPSTFEVRFADDGFVHQVSAGLGRVQGVVVSDAQVVAMRLQEGQVACVSGLRVGFVETGPGS